MTRARKFARASRSPATVIALALGAAPASARDEADHGADPPAPGPAQFNHVTVHQFGPASGKRVLVLMPGTAGRRRRLHPRRPLSGQAGPRPAGLGDRPPHPGARGHGDLPPRADRGRSRCSRPSTTTSRFGGVPLPWRQRADPYARDWGMAVALNDARAVVLRARAHGRPAGRARRTLARRIAHRGLRRLGLQRAPRLQGPRGTRPDRRRAARQLRRLRPRSGPAGRRATCRRATRSSTSSASASPRPPGCSPRSAALYAKKEPTAPATTLQSYPLLPAQFNPPFPVTNRALLGYAFDRDSSPADLGLLHINGGALAAVRQPA